MHKHTLGATPDTPLDAHPAVRDARSMFRRHLAAWATDLLALRSAGLDRPTYRTGDRTARDIVLGYAPHAPATKAA